MVALRRANENGTGCQGAKQLGEVEGNFAKTPAVVGKAGHIARLAPTPAKGPVLFGSIIVVWEGIEGTVHGHGGKPLFEGGG